MLGFNSFSAVAYGKLIDGRKMTKARWRKLGLLYLGWNLNRISLYPLFCLPETIEFHKSSKLLLALFGGNRSSKSFSSAAEVVMVATGQHFWKHPATLPKPPFQIWVMTEDFKTAWDVQLQALLYWLPPDMVKGIRWSGSTHELTVQRPDGDVIIQFRSWTQGFKRQRGRFVALIWFDEEPEDQDVFREMEFRTLGTGVGRIIISCTPQSGTLSYLYDRIVANESGDEEVAFWCLNAYNNFYIDQEALARLDKHAIGEDEAERDMRIRGLFAIKSGKVYKGYNDSYYDEDTNPAGSIVRANLEMPIWWERWLSVDPGYDVCAVGWYAVDPANGDCYKYRESKFSNVAMSEAARELNFIRGKEIIQACIVDGSDPGAAAELQTFLRIRTVLDREFADNLEGMGEKTRKRAGIERVRYYLSGVWGPRLYISEDCMETRKEFQRYAYGDDGEPLKRDDHFMDETRYFISSRPKPKGFLLQETGATPTMAEIIRKLEKQRQSPYNIIGGYDAPRRQDEL